MSKPINWHHINIGVALLALLASLLILFNVQYWNGLVVKSSEANAEIAKPKYKYCLEEFNALVPCPIIEAVIMIESAGNPNAVSKTGAVGLMQLMPIIYTGLCGLTKEEAFDVNKNVTCGTLFLYILIKKYDGNLEKVLLYYNSGAILADNGYKQKVLKELLDVLRK